MWGTCGFVQADKRGAMPLMNSPPHLLAALFYHTSGVRGLFPGAGRVLAGALAFQCKAALGTPRGQVDTAALPP